MITIHTLIAKSIRFEAVLSSNFRAYCFHTSFVDGLILCRLQKDPLNKRV